jgi:hypothetical protein
MSSVRIGCLGNMNNNHFAIVRYLRDRGMDAELLLFDHEFDHFMPAADTFDLSYMSYTRSLTWGSARQFLRAKPTKVLEDLRPYDVLIGCGLAPAYCERAGRTLDIFVPYGADIFDYVSLQAVVPHLIPRVWAAAVQQRRGIANAAVVHMALTNESMEARYRELRGDSERWLQGLPMVHAPTYSPDTIGRMADRTHWGHEFARLRQASDLMLVYHARHCWQCTAGDLNAKGTHKLLEGWSMFVRRHPEIKATLVTLEYGKDVLASKKLIRSLGIEPNVAWLPKMYRKDVMVGLNLADIVCGEFENNWMTGGVLYEALVLGKPILAWRDDEPYKKTYPNLYPILSAREPESIAARLEEYLAAPQAVRAASARGRAWYQTEIVEESLAKYVAYIDGRANGENRRQG